MKITHYMASFRLEDGGVVRAVLDICQVLANRGHDVCIITGDAKDVPAEWRNGVDHAPRVIEVTPPGRNGGFLSKSSVREIEGIVAGSDALHLHTPWDRANRQLAGLACKHGVPYFVSAHGMLDDWSMAQKPWKKKLYLALGGRRLLERAAAIHCTAQGELDQAGKWFPNGRGYVAPCVFDLEPFRELPSTEVATAAIEPASHDGLIVLFLSRLHYKKRPEALIDAAKILKEQGRDTRILIAGTGTDGYEQELKERARERGVDDCVFFLGLVVGEVKLSLFRRADVFSLPTSQENFGFVLVEALVCGTPVVTTKAVDIWPELEESGGAIITEGTAEATAAAIAELLDDSDRARQMGERGRSWVFEALDPERIVARYEKMYTEAIKHKPSP